MIYLASPYTDPSKAVMEGRFQAACLAAAKLMRDGKHVFSPICHCHPMSLFANLPGDWKFWRAYDQDMIHRCGEMAVLMLDGWEESVGVSSEITYAKALGMPVSYIDWVDEMADKWGKK